MNAALLSAMQCVCVCVCVTSVFKISRTNMEFWFYIETVNGRNVFFQAKCGTVFAISGPFIDYDGNSFAHSQFTLETNDAGVKFLIAGRYTCAHGEYEETEYVTFVHHPSESELLWIIDAE
jgi:hypothetical protein